MDRGRGRRNVEGRRRADGRPGNSFFFSLCVVSFKLVSPVRSLSLFFFFFGFHYRPPRGTEPHVGLLNSNYVHDAEANYESMC